MEGTAGKARQERAVQLGWDEGRAEEQQVGTRGGVREGRAAGRAPEAGRGAQTCLLWQQAGGCEHKDALGEKEKKITSALWVRDL